jgi:hypothetical protein
MMAQAPTRLKMLFYRSPTPEGIIRVLAATGCLSRSGRRDRRAVAQLIRKTLDRPADDGPAMPGPTPADRLQNELADAGYLSDRGMEWARTIVGPDWVDPLT